MVGGQEREARIGGRRRRLVDDSFDVPVAVSFDVAVDLIADWGQQEYYTPNLCSVEPYHRYQSSCRKMNFKVFKSLEKS